MKNASILFLFIIVLSACQHKETFILEGTIPTNWEVHNVQLKFLDQELNDSIVIARSDIKSHTFRLEGSVKHPDYVVLRFSNHQSIYLFLENRRIKVHFSPLPKSFLITGSPLNSQLSTFNRQFAPYRQQLQQVRDDIVKARNQQEDTPAFLREKREKMDTIIHEMVKCQKAFIKQHPNSLATAYLLRMSKTDLKIPFVQSVYNHFDDAIKNSSLGRSLQQQIKAREKTALGNSFIDLHLEDVNGGKVLVSELMKQQEYLLLDFWASWCGPCRHENSNILDISKKYRSKGLQIVGISLDTNKDDWQKAIEEDHISWTQLSDLKGWRSPFVARYGIEGIPYTVLIDRQGRIIARGLRAENLREQLKEVFDNKESQTIQHPTAPAIHSQKKEQ